MDILDILSVTLGSLKIHQWEICVTKNKEYNIDALGIYRNNQEYMIYMINKMSFG